jgi:hypothetical protein
MSTIVTSNVSDGTLSIPTTFVTNGSAKAWVNFDGTGTVAIRDSLNVASLTDDGTALYTVNYSSALANSDYCLLGSNKYTGSGTGLSFVLRNVTTPLTASSSQVFCAPDFSVSATDNPIVMLDVKGDLA